MKSVRSTITKLSLVVVAMYGFSYALVPIYDTFCEITGLNGKTNEVAYTGSDIEKENRFIKIKIVIPIEITNNKYFFRILLPSFLFIK